MANPAAMYAVVFFVSCAAFLSLFYGPYQELCVSRARQHMFNARNDLFRFAMTGGISFDDPIYRDLRTGIEKMIRYCHVISWPRLVVHQLVLVKRARKRKSQLFDSLIAMQDTKTRAFLMAIYFRVGFAALLCLMCRSIVLFPVFIVLFLCIKIMDNPVVRKLYALMQSDADRFDEALSSFAPVRARGRGRYQHQ